MHSLLKSLAIAAMTMTAAFVSNAKNYYISSSVAQRGDGEWFWVDDREYQVNQTAFSNIWGLLGKGIEQNSVIYFGEGSYGNITISTPNVELRGVNYGRDCRSNSRLAQESSITGTLTINASGVTINGFRFTGNGCVRNDKAGRGSTSVNDFSFIYNKVEATTIARADNNAIVYLGNAYRPANSDTNLQNPSAWAANYRYQRVNISHNSFYGNTAANQPMFIHLAGTAEGTTINDNEFVDGGTSISLFNTCGEISIEHNRFTDVGKYIRDSGSAKGEFCLRLYYIGLRSVDPATNCYIRHNNFSNCQGQSSMYSLIRFYNGDTNETVYKPVNTNIYCNYNYFSGKNCYRTDGFNYVFYGNDDYTTTANVDWRWNHYDNSELQFAWIKPSWATKAGRYYGGSSEKFNFASDAGTEVGFYGQKDANGNALYGRITPTGGAGGLKGWTVGTSSVTGIPMHTVVQSMDIDDETGDVYLIQECNNNNTSGKSILAAFPGVAWSDALLFMSRVAMGGKETHMYLSYGGHGSNMAVTRYNGQVYILTGGCGTKSDTDPSKICIFPWVDGRAMDLRSHSSIKYLTTNHGHSMPYPAVDNDNRLLLVRSRETTGDYFTVYDLDQAMANPQGAKIIKQVFAPKGSKKITGSSRAFLNSADTGFKTWSDQGFTISGDYIYTYEGDGKGGYASNPTPTDGLAVLIVNVINWRTGEFVSRTAILKSTVLNNMCQGDDSGEPESLKIHRDANGRPFMVIGVITGVGGSYKTPRKYNCFAYKLKSDNGQGLTWNAPTHTIAPNVSDLQMWSTESGATKDVAITKNACLSGTYATITGADADRFTITRTSGDIHDTTHGYSVTFTPDRRKKIYNANIRFSGAGASDAVIPLKATYSGTIESGTDLIENTITPEPAGEPQIYDINGRRLSDYQPGLNIVRFANGQVIKVVK